MTVKERLAGVPGLHWHWSAAAPDQEPIFRGILGRRRPSRIVEIGTYQGVSTALLALYAPVTTVDILPDPVRARVWDAIGVTHRITQHVCRSSAGRDATIAELVKEADLVFVDGGHLMPDVARDFGLAIACGFVVMHDYWVDADSWPDVRQFVDGLDRTRYRVTIEKPFASIEAL
jgi:predicted O-methyltransferase YrrM